MGRKRIFGDPSRVGLGANFKKIRASDYFYIDKTPFIEHFLSDTVEVSLICRPRRFGKSLNMDTLRCFLTDGEDNRELFKGLAVESSDVRGKANSAPVFYFDFKGLTAEGYRDAIFDMASVYLAPYCSRLPESAFKNTLNGYLSRRARETDALRLLTEAAYEATGKKPYILIDEYDKLLLDESNSASYAEIRKFLTYLFSAAFKDNPFLEKGLLTGVMRISYEGLFSGLNNISVYDVFNDGRYNEDFGITDEEAGELVELCSLNSGDLKEWYDGFS
ncbi:MAG: AAA family ATPase, partial [Clostridiales bacterium]|nr:AAA family ATPase [Clostridiales bacterium]